MKQYDFELIKQHSPIREVLQNYGIFQKRGNIPCFVGTHEDKSPSMTIYDKSNTCYCHACHRVVTPIDAVMILDDCSIIEATERLLKMFGLEATETAERYPLTGNDLRYLGLLGSNAGITLISSYEDYDEDIEKYTTHNVRYTLRDMWRDDREGFEYLIATHISERIDYYEYLCALCEMYLTEHEAEFDKLQQGTIPLKELIEAYDHGQRFNKDSIEYRLLCEKEEIRLIKQDLADYKKGRSRLKELDALFPLSKFFEQEKEDYER